MLAIFIIGLTIFANISLIYVLLRHNSASITNRLIAYISIISILWTIFNYLPYTTESEEMRLLYVRTVMFVTSPFGYIIYLLSKAYPNNTLKISNKIDKSIIIIGSIFTIGMAVLSFTPLVFIRVQNGDLNTFSLVSDNGLILYAVAGLSLMLLGFANLTRKYMNTKDMEKKQLQFFLIGLIVTFTLMASSNLLAVILFNSTAFTVLGPTFTLIFISAVTYAIVKHGFLEISTLIVRTLFYLTVMVIIGLAYSALITVLSIIFLRQQVTFTQLLPGMIAAVATAFSFPYLQKRINKITERFFYKNWYDSDQLLYQIALILSSTLDMDELVTLVSKKLDEAMHFSNAAVVVKEEGRLSFHTYKDAWVPTKTEIGDLYSESLQVMKGKQTILNVFSHGSWASRNHVRMVVKLDHDKDTIGLLIIGEKLSGDVFVEKDKSIFSIIAPQLALALMNLQSFQKISSFNITLKEEVERATNKLSSVNRRLLELDKLKDEFVSMASHELRTPMVSIRNYVWMVLNGKGGKVNPKQREYLRRAYDSTSRLSRLVNSMLNLSRIESGRVILSVQQADIRKVIKDVITEIGMRADKAGIKLTLRQKVAEEKSGESAQLPSVLIDIDKIKEVLINLIGNSLKFTPAGGSITATLNVGKEFVKVGITDTGVGLNDEQIPKLFQKFSMLRESYSSNATMAQGTGLGLYISKSIIELHGGKIWIESEGAGKGSTFFFTIPRYSEERLHLLTKNQHNGKDAGIIHSAVTDY